MIGTAGSRRLDVRIVERAGERPVVAVDGAFGSAGLELSHWPGNRTPPEFRHDLSTGCALRFARLSADERAARLAGIDTLVNNHYDTDGVLAAWTVLHPERALELEATLLDAAAAGDFFAVPSRHAFAIDVAIGALADAEHSPIAADFAGLGDSARRELAFLRALERVEAWLREPPDGPSWSDVRDTVERALERLEADLAALASCGRTHHAGRDLVHFVAAAPIAPGRHALFHAAGADRVLVSAAAADGWTHRLVVGTRSWFDLASAAPPPRPDLGHAVRALSERESARGDAAWRAQDSGSPSPEMWFGTADLEWFAEHSTALVASRLAPAEVLAELLTAPAR